MSQGRLTSLRSLVLEFFNKSGWKYEEPPTENYIALDFKGPHGAWKVYAFIQEDIRYFSMNSNMPFFVPAGRRFALAELAARINHELPLSYVDLDVDSGLLNVRFDLDLSGTEPSNEMLASYILGNLDAVNRYFPALLGIAFGERSAGELFHEVSHAPRHERTA